jgi:pyruvate dehydrogenase E2 component (dihydrolipoamide acetyltransferase)
MAEDLFIPKLGQTVEEVVLINWLVEDGDKVNFGDPVLEVETDKAIFNVEANAKGYIHFGTYEIGETVPVLTVVATIGKKDEDFSPSGEVVEKLAKSAPVEEAESQQAAVTQEIEQENGTSGEIQKLFASPRARKLARDKHVDLSQVTPTGGGGMRVTEDDVIAYLEQKPKVTPVAAALAEEMNLNLAGLKGTGPQGRITRRDVENVIHQCLTSAQGGAASSLPDIKYATNRVLETKPVDGVRRIIFDRMGTSDRLTARVTMVTEADATELVNFREKLKAAKEELWGFKPGYNDLIGMIVAQTLQSHRYMNARLSEDGSRIEILEDINLGFAVDTDRGLLVPVLKQADKLSLESLGSQFQALVSAAKSGRISPEDLSGGTFTITNLGIYDVDAFTPIINLPELAILGIGRISDQVVPFQGDVVIRKMMTLSLVFDHRLVDGAPAAKFLKEVKDAIENPILHFVKI